MLNIYSMGWLFVLYLNMFRHTKLAKVQMITFDSMEHWPLISVETVLKVVCFSHSPHMSTKVFRHVNNCFKM